MEVFFRLMKRLFAITTKAGITLSEVLLLPLVFKKIFTMKMKKILVYIFNIVAGYWSSWITGALMRVIAAEKKNISMEKKVR